MGGHPFQEIPCVLCNKPVDLSADLHADENGKAVHEECYVENITGSLSRITATMAADQVNCCEEEIGI
jgi:hypothetical protein